MKKLMTYMADKSSQTNVDLTNCDREPIQVPGSIQSHGCLTDVRIMRIRRHSLNAPAMLETESDVNGRTIPTSEICIDATAYVQAFLFNVFGALDNLAWIWVQEKDIRNNDGGQLKDTRVGLGKKYREIKRTFSNEFANT